MLTKSQVFGKNQGAVKSWERSLDGAELTVATKATESWHQTRQEYLEPDVTTCNDRSADIFWRGCSNGISNGERKIERRKDLAYTIEGLKLYPGWYKDSKTMTYWVNNEVNYRFVISIYKGEVVVTVWANTNVSGRWIGGRIESRYCGDWQLPSSERDAIMYIILKSHELSQPVYILACCADPQPRRSAGGKQRWCHSCKTQLKP